MILTALVFFIILSVLVLIHELGHFLVAKKLGIKVEEFGFGLPPRLWGVKRGETIYSINWLPIGGFVKLFGEDDAGAGRVTTKTQAKKTDSKTDLKRAFFNRSVPQRAAVVVAGVVMNAILAAVLFYGFLALTQFKTSVPLLSDYHFFGATQKNYNLNATDIVVSNVAPNSPAEKSGISAPSQVTRVNGKTIKDREAFIQLVDQQKGKKLSLELKNQVTDQTYQVALVPRVNPPKNEGALGITFFPVAIVSYQTPFQKVASGIIHPINMLVYNFDLFSKLIAVSIQEKNPTAVGEGVSGPVGIFSLVGSILDMPNAKERVLQLLNLAGLLSISLAFFNILPIPALDGGRLFFILIEGITRRKVNPKYETLAHTIGMAVLLTLILLITFKDIFQFFL